MLEKLRISLNHCTDAIVGISRATLHELELHVIQMLFVSDNCGSAPLMKYLEQ